jgi:hypothetical protein
MTNSLFSSNFDLYRITKLYAEHRGHVVGNPASYSGGPGLKSQPGDMLS